MIINQIIKCIKDSNKIAISFHSSPDGDSIGSSFALCRALKKFGKNVYIVCIDNIPDNLQFLNEDEEVTVSRDVTSDTSCLIVLDCGNLQRISINTDLSKRDFSLINIDHHVSNDMYGDLNFIDTNASAVGEIIYQILKLMGISIDTKIAACLYTSLITDTGSFRHSNTTAVTHGIAGDLINTNLNFSKIHRYIFDQEKFSSIKLTGKVIDSMYLTLSNKVCIMLITKDMVDQLNLDAYDSSNMVNIGLKVKEVETSVLFKEVDKNTIKVSLRSKDFLDVRKIAEHFGGGGHIRAAGATIDSNINDAVTLVLERLKKEMI